jgi:hypothetical protein
MESFQDPAFLRIFGMPLSLEAKDGLWRWVKSQRRVLENSPNLVSENILLSQIQDLGQKDKPKTLALIDAALTASMDSPLAKLRFRRLSMILQKPNGLLASKLRELSDPDFQIMGSRYGKIPSSAEKILKSQWDAYLGDPYVAQNIHELYSQSADLLQPEAAARRLQRRDEILEKFFQGRRRGHPLNNSDIVKAFRMLGDPVSLEIAEAIATEVFELRLRDNKTFEYEILLAPGGGIGDVRIENAAFFYAGLLGPKAVMLVRSTPIPLYPDANAYDVFFEILGKIRHEYKHHLDIQAGEKRGTILSFKQESAAKVEEYLWRAQHGDVRLLENVHRRAPAGFGLWWRNHFEALLWNWI